MCDSNADADDAGLTADLDFDEPTFIERGYALLEKLRLTTGQLLTDDESVDLERIVDLWRAVMESKG